ncbi:MAG: hypothetical protein GF364_03235 [Candidatus Lokiarchaeota archaeon]|nr:hypothetical protein [Candidatus Lokiarchaeota archaeon]
MKKLIRRNIMRKCSAITFLFIFIVGMAILPKINSISNDGSINSSIDDPNTSYRYPSRDTPLSIEDWANLSCEAGKWLEDKADKLSGYSWNSSAGIYYMNKKQGAAGIGLLFIELYKKTKDSSYLDAAIEIGNWYDAKSSDLLKPGKWPQYNSSIAENLTGIDYGAAGVGEFLYSLYAETENPTILQLANDVSYYLETLAVNELDGTKYPKKESQRIEDEEDTFSVDSGLYGTTSGSISNLALNDNTYYTISTANIILTEQNMYDSGNLDTYSIGTSETHPSDCVQLSQQFRFDGYPIVLDNGVDIMIYVDEDVTDDGALRVRIYEAKQSGQPNMSAPVGGWSDKVFFDDPQMYTEPGHNVTFTWGGSVPVLNGSSIYGYSLVIDEDSTTGLPSNDWFYAVVTTDSSYNRGSLSYQKNGWKSASGSKNLVFKITSNQDHYATHNFKYNLTDFGLIPAFDINYIDNISIDCRIRTQPGMDYAEIYIYNRLSGLYESFGSITSTEQQLNLLIEDDYSNYLSPVLREIVVRVATGDTSSTGDIEIDVLNITLNYNDEFFGYDLESGVTGIGEYFLEVYSLTGNETYLERAQEIGNFLINNAITINEGGKTCAAWIHEDGSYYTGRSKGMAGIGSFLLKLGLLNSSNNQYKNYAKYTANWLLISGRTLAAKDYLGRSLGTTTYWRSKNTSSLIYNGYQTGIAGIADFLLDIGLILSEEDESNDYLLNATFAGNFLISSASDSDVTTSAVQNVYTYYWTTRAYPRDSIDLSYATGTAGVLKFLNRLYLHTHNTNYSKCVSGAYGYYKMHIKDNPSGPGKYWNLTSQTDKSYGLAGGVAGVALSLLDVEFSSYFAINSAKDAIDWLYSQRDEETSTEYRFSVSEGTNLYYSGLARGTAGVGISFLSMFEKTLNNTYFTWASYCANSLQNQADWAIHSSDSGNYSIGIADGVAGIGLFFLQMVKSSDIAQHKNTLLAIADYIIDNAITDGDGYYWVNSTSAQEDEAYFGYDYGTAGVLYFLTELYRYRKNSTYLDYAEGAARWLDDYDTSGVWEEYLGALAADPNGFSKGSAGIGYSLLNLYDLTKNSTYLTLVDKIYTYLESELTTHSDAIPIDDSSSVKYNGIENGQAGILKFLSQYYNYDKSTSVYDTIDTLLIWLQNKQESDGSFFVSVPGTEVYNSFKRGTIGIINGLIESYGSNIDSDILTVVSQATDNILQQQDTDGYWDDNSDSGVYLGYYDGVAGIIDQLLMVPDLEGPSLLLTMNISLETEIVSYSEYLEINVSSEDVSSGIEDVILAYKYNNEEISESSFADVGSGKYRIVFPNNDYDTNVTFYIVSIDGSGIINIEDNSSSLYKFTYGDEIDPNINAPQTYDSGGNIGPIQYNTGGRIEVFIDEPSGSSGLESVTITYDNLDDENPTPTTTAMTENSQTNNLYYINIPGAGYEYGDDFEYSITAVDNAGNTDETGDLSTTIGDSIAPIKLSHKIHEQNQIPAYTKVELAMEVRDALTTSDPIGSGINNVYVNYTIDGGNSWDQLYLTYDSQTGTYTGELPGQRMGKNVAYMLCIEDIAGNIAYYGSSDTRFTTPLGTNDLYRFEIVINWVITGLVVGAIAAVTIIAYLIYTRQTDYWDRMRHQAGATARMISIQERFTNIWYAILERLSVWGNKILEKIQRPPGSPSPLKEWYEERVGEGFKRIIRGIGKTFKMAGKFLLLSIVSPFILIWSIIKYSGIRRVSLAALFSLLLIVFSVIRYIDEGAYPLRALFFVNFGFILFITSFVVLIFHLLYRIAYK